MCPSCGGDVRHNWRDRATCATPCTAFHTRCASCGEALDGCMWMPVGDWKPIHLAARLAGRNVKTVRTWVNRGMVGSKYAEGYHLVYVPDLRTLTAERDWRTR